MAVTFTEVVDNVSPATVGFSQDGGRGVTVYQCLSEDLGDVAEHLVGYTENDTQDGRLVRHLPRAHPRFPWLFVERIAQIQGRGVGSAVAAAADLEAPAVPYGSSYPYYWLTVEWAPRPYAVLPDDRIIHGNVTYYDEAGDEQSHTYVDEWERYCDVLHFGSVELVTAQQGQMVLRRGDADPPDKYTFPGQPQIRLPQRLVKVIWHQVPYRYVSSPNSYFDATMGRINQAEFLGFPAGSLLCEPYNVIRRSTPPFPEVVQLEGLRARSTEKVCDVELNFLYVKRTAGAAAATPDNPNWVAAGHNLLPWFGDRKFYYATSFDPADKTDEAAWVPTYLSAPFELLFMDPDV